MFLVRLCTHRPLPWPHVEIDNSLELDQFPTRHCPPLLRYNILLPPGPVFWRVHMHTRERLHLPDRESNAWGWVCVSVRECAWVNSWDKKQEDCLSVKSDENGCMHCVNDFPVCKCVIHTVYNFTQKLNLVEKGTCNSCVSGLCHICSCSHGWFWTTVCIWKKYFKCFLDPSCRDTQLSNWIFIRNVGSET